MKNFVLGLTAVAGIAASANAAWGFKYQFSTNGGATWTNNASVDVSSGDKNVKFRVLAYADPGTTVIVGDGSTNGPAVAFARLTGSEKMSNWGSASNGDAFVGSMTRGELTNGNAAYLTSSLSGGNAILGTTTALSFASILLNSGQLAAYCPSSGGTPDLEWIVRTGEIKVGQLGGTRTITFGNNQRTTNTWYRDFLSNGVQDVNTGTPASADLVDVGASLQVVPAPGALALVGLGGLVAARRRRA